MTPFGDNPFRGKYVCPGEYTFVSSGVVGFLDKTPCVWQREVTPGECSGAIHCGPDMRLG